MTALLRALIEWARRIESETPEQYMARRFPHLVPNPPWSDGSDF